MIVIYYERLDFDICPFDHSIKRKRPRKRVVYADASSSDESTGAKVVIPG